ncbi:MAG: mannose-1-phosphate guanylyltransferase [Bacteroidota bacterium]
MPKPVIVIMAGGRGERLWPLSRRKYPKQLLNLAGDESLLQQSVARIWSLTDDDRIFVVTNIDYLGEVRRQLMMLPERNILGEPEGRNTAPCVGLAVIYVQNRFPGEDPSLAILPSDVKINAAAEMRIALQAGLDYAQSRDRGVIYGMRPTRPETGYGYIQLGECSGDAKGVSFFKVAAFKEKPDQATAEQYFRSKDFLWNAGIFVWKAGGLLKEIQTYLPELATGLEKLRPYLGTEAEFSKLAEIYPTLPATSVDYGILEKTANLVVVPTEFGWDDLGSWSSLERVLPQDQSGNAVQGALVGVECEGLIVYSPKKTVAALGVSNLIIVETDDVLMVCAKEKAQEVKQLIAKLKAEKRGKLL